MIIKKYTANTEKDAIEKAKEELGAQAIVMNVKKVHPKGILRIFLRSKVEVTAALEENAIYSEEQQRKEREAKKNAKTGQAFDVSIPPLEELPPLEGATGSESKKNDPAPTASRPPIPNVPVENLEKQTNEERLSQLFALLEKQMEEKVSEGTDEPTSKVMSRPTATPKVKTEREALEYKVSSSRNNNSDKEDITGKKETDVSSLVEDESDTENLSEEAEKEKKSAVYRELIYKQLIDNEVDPSIADSILDEAKRALPKDAAVDQILGSVYQRIILMIGQPYTIDYKPNEATKFVYFLGSTGVGKTTTIAKLASRLKLEENCNLALVTADTYRVAAVEQLKVYADILSVPLFVVYDPTELGGMIDDLSKYDVVLIDTAGCSHKNKEQIEDVQTLLDQVPVSKRMVYLALSVGTKYKDLQEISKVYSELTDYSIIFTKLDETSSAGVMLNMKMSTKCPLSYLTNGQNVPDDIEKIDAQTLAKQLMS